MGPTFALDVASMGDAMTGINRADSASVNVGPLIRDGEHHPDRPWHRALCSVTKPPAFEFHVKQGACTRAFDVACRQC
jgi:hypothetical protein